MAKPLVAILMGSDSDLPVMRAASDLLTSWQIEHEVTIASAHRSPERTAALAKGAAERGLQVIIAAAGGAAHLAGFVAALTPLPVIGVPIQSGALNGVDALYATVQMPPGVPVATVGVNAAANAAILAAQILSVSDPELREKILAYKAELARGVQAKADKLASLGVDAFLKARS